MELEITSRSKSPQELRDLLETHLDWDDSYGTLGVRISTRSTLTDPAVLVAVVGSTGTVLGALITALLRIAQGEIVIQTGDGDIIKVPAGTSLKKIDQLIQKLIAMRARIDRISMP